MAATFQGLSAYRTPGEIRQVIVNTSGLKEGAIVIWDSSAAGGSTKAPTGAGNTGIAGVLIDVLPSAGTTSGGLYNIQRSGVCPVLLDAGQSVTVGGKVIISDTDGSCKALGTTDSCDILGVALQTLTAGSANDLINVELQIQFSGDTVP
jgi:hypothetical protein